ncbi:PREDICTED: coiled-coil domain-containing protein 173 [Propithecus coquereli]|uniref:coiled-coil domain-containing protein 173 n=1 Tax=Propithecus coquereli TaxID=379532 RepID=UPI00063F9837|nr:PREDICTED: coiled-coil domain-containing protein 173 [Propithecus coquereli]
MGTSSQMLARFGRRRCGRAKKNTEIRNSEEDQVPHPPLLPSKVDLQQVTIIPHDEWKRIQDSLDSLTREAACLRAERKAKKEMHFRSQEVVKHWTNTYAGMKEQKLEAKKKRDEEIEAERQILDVEEAIHKQGERKKAIENAKQYQFYQTERVKNFHSGLLLSRVMKERDAQIEFQKSKIKSDKKWEEQLKLNVEKAVKEEQEKAEKRYRERVALAQDHLKQLMEERRERINNFLSELMKEKLDNEDLIIARDIAEAEAEWEKREGEKYEKNKAELKAIAEYRATVMKNKEEEERQRKIEAQEQLLAVMKADQIFWEHEKEKKRKADKEHREVQDFHIQQMAKNKVNAKEAKQAELDYCRLTEALAVEKEKEFQDYAREVIELESETTNKYIYPLVKAVQEGPGGGCGPVFVDRGGLRPSYQANDITGVQLPFYNSQGSKYSFQKSKGRLGFTW